MWGSVFNREVMEPGYKDETVEELPFPFKDHRESSNEPWKFLTKIQERKNRKKILRFLLSFLSL